MIRPFRSAACAGVVTLLALLAACNAPTPTPSPSATNTPPSSTAAPSHAAPTSAPPSVQAAPPTEPLVFDRPAAATSLADDFIVPRLQQTHNAVFFLAVLAEEFETKPSLDLLTRLRQTFLGTVNTWSAAELFKLGPWDTLETAQEFDFHQTRTNVIEKILAGSKPLDNIYGAGAGAATLGLGSIEYLLFGDGASPEQVFSRFEGEDGARRRKYLAQATLFAAEAMGRVVEAWSPEGNNYRSTFTGNPQLAFGLVLTQIVILTEDIKNNQIGGPLGKTTGGKPLPHLIEGRRSQTTVSRMQRNIASIRETFAGRNGAGLADALKSRNPDLAARTLAQMDTVSASINALTEPFEPMLSAHPDTVDTVFLETQKLVRLIKSEVLSAFGVTLTFTDVDGD